MQEPEGEGQEQLKVLQEAKIKEFYFALAESFLLLGRFVKEVGEFREKSKVNQLIFETPKLSVKLFTLLGKKR